MKTAALHRILPSLKLGKYQRTVSIASDHHIPRAKREDLLALLEAHRCQWSCMILTANATAASSSVSPITVAPIRNPVNESSARALRRDNREQQAINEDERDQIWWRDNWPQLETPNALKDVHLAYWPV